LTKSLTTTFNEMATGLDAHARFLCANIRLGCSQFAAHEALVSSLGFRWRATLGLTNACPESPLERSSRDVGRRDRLRNCQPARRKGRSRNGGFSRQGYRLSRR
jgi:hypothetical protein